MKLLLEVKIIMIFVTSVIMTFTVVSAGIPYLAYGQKDNFVNHARNLDYIRNITYNTSSQVMVQKSNITNALEMVLNQTTKAESSEDGYFCVPAPFGTDFPGWHCERCSAFPGLCSDLI